MMAAFGIFLQTQPVQAMIALPTPTPTPLTYPVMIFPSLTDGPGSGSDGTVPCDGQTGLGIGCDDPDDPDDANDYFEWGELANNKEHFLYLPDNANGKTPRLSLRW